MIELSANKVDLAVLSKETITSGSEGVYTCKFTFSAEWDGFSRVAVFRSAGDRWEAAIDRENSCIIPREAMQIAYCELSVGVYGVDGDGKVMPTMWASLGTIQPSPKRVKPSCPSTGGSTGGGTCECETSVYVPHIDDRKILTYTIEKSPKGVPEPVDLNPFDEWIDMGSSGGETDYTWEEL